MAIYGLAALGAGLGAGLSASPGAAADHSWQRPHAQVLPQGDLAWQPEPFVFQAGASIRYIDFEGGADANDGLSTATPWKHHPWDPNATVVAAAASGVHTYVFKRGVIYRGQLLPDESGAAGDPIRLTSDPAWGSGEACIYGSEAVTGWTQGPAGIHPDIPQPGSVWRADLNFLPRAVWAVDGAGAITRLNLARETDWTVTAPINDGAWRHVVVEVDRAAGMATFYVDGAAEAMAFSLSGSLSNTADLFVGQGLAGTLDFLRVSRGTLAEARTTIAELREWQFNGPFLRDFKGAAPNGPRRDAGALESEPVPVTLSGFSIE